MGDTGGNMAHWAAGLYGGGAPTAEATVVTTTVSSPTSVGSGGGSPTRPGVHPPGVEGGQVGKSAARRRSRASRRAPVTLLNTDTSNFRAMVQQFTGIPSGPYGPAGGPGGPVISFGGPGEYGSSLPVRPSPTSAVMSFDHHHQQHLAAAAASRHRPPTSSSSLQGQQLFRPQPQQQQYGYDSGMHGGGGGGDMSSFLHGFESSSAEDRLLLQSIHAAQMMPSRPASTNNTTSGYNFG